MSAGDLVAELRRQLESGAGPARTEPFASAVDVTQFDAATRTFGFAATARIYRRLTGSRAYDGFGTAQRNWALGANAWGTSLVIGEGTVFPHCPQHQVANLAGSLTGGRHVLVGAVVNGPNGAENFEDIGIPDGARACPVDGRNRFAAFDRPDARFLDDVRAWPSVEPAIDFTSTGMLALLGQDSSLVVAAATLVVAAVFQPARRRVQSAVDRRFNRRRHDAGRVIEAFGARLRDQVDLDTLTAEVIAVADQTMQPTTAWLWLRPGQAGSGPARPRPSSG